MREKSVEVVVINYKRPFNMVAICKSFKEQTYPVRLSIVNVIEDGDSLPLGCRLLADTIYPLYENFGAYNRYVPMGAYDCDYTYFHDDDMLPGKRCIEHFVKHANEVGDEFSVMGQYGRKYFNGSWNGRNVERQAGSFTPVDVVVRGYFVNTFTLWCMDTFRRTALKYRLPYREDDIVLNAGINFYYGAPCLMTLCDDDPETLINKKELPAPFSNSSNVALHKESREKTIADCMKAGWKTLEMKSKEVEQ